MSDENNGAPAPNATPVPATPAAPAAPAAPSAVPPPAAASAIPAPAASPPPVAPPVPPAAVPTPQAQDPNWLKGRLEQAERSAQQKLLAELGVTDPGAAKAAIAAAQAAEEANKTAEQKAAELATKLETQSAETRRYQEATRVHANALLATLGEERRAAVVALAGDDPAKQLNTIGVLTPTWNKQEQEAASAAQAAAQAAASAQAAAPTPPAAPAPDTAPPPDAPSGSTESPPNHRTVWETARSKNPFAAAAYGAQHPTIYSSD